MVHAIIALETDSQTHNNFVTALNRRKYHFKSTREGYTRAHVSEVRLYDIRAKKEVMPHILQDLGVETFMPEKKIRLWDVLKKSKNASGKDAFFDGRSKILISYIMQKLGRFVKMENPKITLAKDRKPVPLVPGWYYAFNVGNIKDTDSRGFGEEL